MTAPRPRHSFQRTLLTGLLTLLPLWLTWVVVKFVFVLLSDLGRPSCIRCWRSWPRSNPRWPG